jgi:hypothetical protein
VDTPNFKTKSYAEPTVSPYTLRAVAIGHFLFAGLTIAVVAARSVLDGTNIDQSFAGAVAHIDSPQAQAIRAKLQRTADLKDSLQKHLNRQVPSRIWLEPMNQTVNVGLALLLLAAGSCLSQRRPLGQKLSFVFAGVCLVQQLGMMAWQHIAEVPAARQYLEQLMRLYPNDAELIRGILTPINNGPTFHLLVAAYPLCVLAVMVQPGIKTLLQPRSANEATTNKSPALCQLPTCQLPSENIPADPLEALLHRKTF